MAFCARAQKPLQVLWPLVYCAGVTVFTEWIHRDDLSGFWQNYFLPNFAAYALGWLLLVIGYGFVWAATRRHWPAALFVGVLGCAPAAVCYFELQFRGEPFLPWDISQFTEATQVAGKSGLEIRPSMTAAILFVAAGVVFSFFLPRAAKARRLWLGRIALMGGLLWGLVFGVYLQGPVTLALGIVPDEWMQNRYYRNYGVLTGFMTNLQNLDIEEPEGYSREAVEELKTWLETTARPRAFFEGSYADLTADKETEKTPNIIYVMDEAFWDVSRLEEYGVVFDRELCPNLHRLQQTSAHGFIYSPSFGGGTCDVEFEALTGHSCAYLPSGCKPYQQHVVKEMFSTPAYLKEEQGYQTMAIHGYFKKFWNRVRAYPNLGIDTFIGLENISGAEKKRDVYWHGGLMTDAEMGRQIIAAFEERKDGAPLFLHAVTMQNHTSYSAANYPDEERVRVLQAPEGMSESTLGALEDFATGVWYADQMLGQLTDHFAREEEPVILVFWGDHYNPIGSGYEVYTSTGYAPANSTDPALHQNDLLIWSNYFEGEVELGTVGTYEVSPVMMDLYGLDKPPYYEYLTRQLEVYRSRAVGVTINPDGTAAEELDERQLGWYRDHWILQYDMMFGQEYFLEETGQN